MLPIEIEKRMDAIRAEVEQAGIELIEVQFRRASSRSVLTLIVDKPGGVTLEDCAGANRRVGDYLDRETTTDGGSGFLLDSYFLEVNSPGLDRPLKTPKDFERFKGGAVRVAWRHENGAGLVTLGKLREVDEHGVTLEDKKGNTARISFESITKATRDVGL